MAQKGWIFIISYLLIQVKFSHGLQCYSCDSSSDENCATLKLNTTFIDCDDNCAIWVEGTITKRGCEAGIPIGTEKFKICDTLACNKIIFPEDRMKCVSCSADDDFCTTPTADLLYPCKNYAENDSCYTYVIDETSAIRGCLSDLDTNVDLCNSVGEICIKCSEEFCNLQGGKSYIDCVSCSSENDPSCGYTQDDSALTKLCNQLLGRENLCFAYGNQTHFQRGCLIDAPELKPLCKENSEKCQICDEDSCNAMKIVEELCVNCDSRTDLDCKTMVGVQTPTLCGEGTINKSGCYLSDKDDVTRRGCVSSLTDSGAKECEDGGTCKVCHGEMCNRKLSFQRCQSCNSQDDVNCATLQGSLTEKVCDDYLDTCTVYVKPNSTTHRGCSKELSSDGVECSPQSVNCKQCSDNNCNGEAFPANRLTCFHCEGDSTDHECYKSLENSVALSHPCQTYNFRDSCYLYITDKNVIQRGCLSDAVNATEMCKINPDKCRTCQSSNCNLESVMKKPDLSCVTCDTTQGEDCNWGWLPSSANKCKKERFFYENESCYVLQFSDQTIRGCTLDGNVCRNSSWCELCQDDACNRKNTAQQFCYECLSESDDNCGPEPFHTKNVTCQGVIQYDHRGCYTWIDDELNVARGCFSDFSVNKRMECLSDNENCERCVDEVNCNDRPKGLAASATLSFTLISLSIAINKLSS